MEYDRAQLKRNVKRSMKHTNPKPMLVTLLFVAVVAAGTWLINIVLGRLLTGGVGSVSDSLWLYMRRGYELGEALYIVMLELFRRGPGVMFSSIVGGSLLSIIISLWQSTMGVGYSGYCLSMVRNENPPIDKIFGVLPRFPQVLVTRVLTGIFQALWSLPVAAGCVVVLSVVVFLYTPVVTEVLILADSVLFMLGVLWLTMRYALVNFLLVDRGLSGLDAIRESKRLMRGNIGRGVVFQLSFLGWGLLVIAIIWGGILVPMAIILSQLTSMEGLVAAAGLALLIAAAAAIGTAVLMLWLQPYMNGGWAKFYDWAAGAADGFGGGSGHGGGGRSWEERGADYNWSTGPSSGTGVGSGPAWGNGGQPPKPPSPPKPRDDPWN